MYEKAPSVQIDEGRGSLDHRKMWTRGRLKEDWSVVNWEMDGYMGDDDVVGVFFDGSVYIQFFD